MDELTEKGVEVDMILVDPPYVGTTGYNNNLNVMEVVNKISKDIPIYVSECSTLSGKYEFITKGKSR